MEDQEEAASVEVASEEAAQEAADLEAEATAEDRATAALDTARFSVATVAHTITAEAVVSADFWDSSCFP